MDTSPTPELSVVILCYRAGQGVRDFVAKAKTALENAGVVDYQLVLVGNFHPGVADDTPAVVAALAAADPKIVAVTKPKQGMMGWDMRSGFSLATGHYVTVIDGDGQMPVEDVVRVYKKIKHDGSDLVKTYRMVRGDGPWRIFISTVYNLLFKVLFPGLHSRDINAKPKIMTQAAYQRLRLTADDWFADAEIMIQARRYKFTIGEIPTTFRGLAGSRKSFVGFPTIFEFIKNLIAYRLKEFSIKKQ